MTNDFRAGKLAIQKCDKCRDGYLIVKSGKQNGFFLGCTNYKTDGTGCGRTIAKKYYYDQMGYDMEPEAAPIVKGESVKASVKKELKLSGIETKTSDYKPNVRQAKAMDDFIIIQRADLKPVVYNELDLNELIFTVVKALQNVSRVRFYGVSMLADVLRGVDNKRISDNRLDKIPEYGVLKKLSGETVKSVIEWMISEHLILKTKERYPVLHSTYEGLHYSEVMTEGKLKRLKKYLEEEVVLRSEEHPHRTETARRI